MAPGGTRSPARTFRHAVAPNEQRERASPFVGGRSRTAVHADYPAETEAGQPQPGQRARPGIRQPEVWRRVGPSRGRADRSRWNYRVIRSPAVAEIVGDVPAREPSPRRAAKLDLLGVTFGHRLEDLHEPWQDPVQDRRREAAEQASIGRVTAAELLPALIGTSDRSTTPAISPRMYLIQSLDSYVVSYVPDRRSGFSSAPELPITDLSAREDDVQLSAMRYLNTIEAASLLNVGPSTLRAWERRFGFPEPRRSAGGHRWYLHGEVAALRQALQGGLSLSAAVLQARASLAADANSLVRALLAYDRDRADRAMETALALRSVEHAVEDVLLPSLDEIVGRNGPHSAGWAFSAHWAADWLGRARRLTPQPAVRLAIVLGRASWDELDLDAPYIRALELFCERAGVKVLSLPAGTVTGLGSAAATHAPDVVVLAGRQLDDQTVARWGTILQRSIGAIPLALYRPPTDRMWGRVLPAAPSDAQLCLMEVADDATPRQLARAG